MPLDVDCYKPTLVDNNVQVLDAALEIDLNYWVQSDDLFRLLINDDLLLMNLWSQDVLVVRDAKVDAVTERIQMRLLRSLWMLDRNCRARVDL